MPSSLPAGWYNDPHGLAPQRWWDGTSWTEHTNPDPTQPANDAGVVRAPAQASHRQDGSNRGAVIASPRVGPRRQVNWWQLLNPVAWFKAAMGTLFVMFFVVYAVISLLDDASQQVQYALMWTIAGFLFVGIMVGMVFFPDDDPKN